MSWLFSQALVEEYSLGISSDGVVFALSSEMSTQQAFSCSGKTMEFSLRSQFGMTYARLTAAAGEELLTWFLEGFPARHTARRLRGGTMRTISGRRCGESWQMQLPGTYLPRTSAKEQLTRRRTTAKRWVTKPAAFPLPRQTWVAITFGSDIGFLHTPTTKANYSAASMQKWPCARSFSTVFGRPTPANQEWLMGWPIGWSDIEPLETGKFRSWLSQHCVPCVLTEEPHQP